MLNGARGVEGAVGKRKPLGNPAMHADLRETVADRRDVKDHHARVGGYAGGRRRER
jgi:hypothetical protein